MTPLNRAFALEQMDDVAVMIGEDLEFDMTRPLDQSLDVERAVTEGRDRFASGLRDRRDEDVLVARRLHPDAAAALGRLEQHGKADAPRRLGNRIV